MTKKTRKSAKTTPDLSHYGQAIIVTLSNGMVLRALAPAVMTPDQHAEFMSSNGPRCVGISIGEPVELKDGETWVGM